jgi:hypothetical protein
MQAAQIQRDHSHVLVIQDTQEMGHTVLISMSVKPIHTTVIQILHAQIMLVHSHALATLGTQEMEHYA